MCMKPGKSGSKWCGIACVQMWADYNGIQVTQQQIADAIGVAGNDTASPFELETAVGSFTCYEGYCATREFWEAGSQGDLIGATIYAIQDYVPSIMPYFETHAVLVKGYKMALSWKMNN